MKKNFNVFNFLLKIGYDILIAFCIILIMVIIMQKVTDNEGSIAGYRLFTVISGSMEPKYNIGEVVVCKEIDVNDIKIGDTIIYKGRTGQINGKMIMHDVVNITNNDKTLIFHARGLENNQEDPDIKPDQIYGICVFESYLLTLLYDLATSTYASAIIIMVLVLNVFLSFRSKKENPRKLEEKDDIYIDNVINSEELDNQTVINENETKITNENVNSKEEIKEIMSKYKEIKRRRKIETENINKIELEMKRRLKKN